MAGTASDPASLRWTQDKIESARKASSNKVKDVDASLYRRKVLRQFQLERESAKTMLKVIESAKSRQLTAEQMGTVEEDMVLVEKDEI